jgi:hypothetical protein
MPKLTGKKVPKFLRDRGIRWIMPEGVRLNFNHEQELREEAYRAGYAQGLTDGKHATKCVHAGASVYIPQYRKDMWDRHCRRLGFTPMELESLEPSSTTSTTTTKTTMETK